MRRTITTVVVFGISLVALGLFLLRVYIDQL